MVSFQDLDAWVRRPASAVACLGLSSALCRLLWEVHTPSLGLETVG